MSVGLKQEILRPNQLFWAMHKAAAKDRRGKKDLQERFLFSLDPGETTGYAIRSPTNPGEIICGQVPTKTIEAGYDTICLLRPATAFSVEWIVENYKVYSWKADDHSWAGLHTAQLIGAIKIAVHSNKARGDCFNTRMAQQAKNFATDENLKRWSLYSTGLRHGRDAVRHLVTSLFFGH